MGLWIWELAHNVPFEIYHLKNLGTIVEHMEHFAICSTIFPVFLTKC